MFKLFVKTIEQSNNYSSFMDKLVNMSTNEKGYMFEYLCKYVFLLHPQYQKFIQNVYLYNDIPIDLIKKLNLPEKDKGIDILLQTIDNEYIPVQCKFRQKKYSKIYWSTLSTFAGQSFGLNDIFSRAIYITNIYHIDTEIDRSHKIMCINGIFFDNLKKIFFDKLKIFLKNGTKVHHNYFPRSYQQTAINHCKKYFNSNNKGYINMACGTGKTITSAFIDKDMNNKKTLIFVPSLYLLSQIYSEWSCLYSYKQNIKFILIGSNNDINNNYNNVLLTTDINIIKDKLNMYKNDKIIIISTYQSSKKLNKINIHWDMIIYDEAHRTTGYDEQLFSNSIADSFIPAKKRLFMTATPKIYTNIEPVSGTVYSMDNKNMYGDLIYKYTIRNGINDGYLSDYTICTLNIDNLNVKRYFINNELVYTENIVTDSHNMACALATKNAVNDLNCKHMLTYHNSIKNSKNFVKLVKIIDPTINIHHIDGTMNIIKRKKIIESFKKNSPSIISSSKILSEGVNINIVDSEFFVDTRHSPIDIIQCIGRALRLHKNKKNAKIIVPILSEEHTKSGKFSSIISVMKSLALYDTNIDKIATKKTKDYDFLNFIESDNLEKQRDKYINIDINKWMKHITFDMIKKNNISINNPVSVPEKASVSVRYKKVKSRNHRKYYCKNCKYNTPYRSKWIKHLNTNKHIKLNRCKYCQKYIKYYKNFKYHYSICKNKKNYIEKVEEEPFYIIIDNNSKYKTTRTLKSRFIINNFKNTTNIKDLFNTPTSNTEEKYFFDHGPIKGFEKYFYGRCVNNIEPSKRSIYCTDYSKKKTLIKINDKWEVDIGCKIIIDIIKNNINAIINKYLSDNKDNKDNKELLWYNEEFHNLIKDDYLMARRIICRMILSSNLYVYIKPK